MNKIVMQTMQHLHHPNHEYAIAHHYSMLGPIAEWCDWSFARDSMSSSIYRNIIWQEHCSFRRHHKCSQPKGDMHCSFNKWWSMRWCFIDYEDDVKLLYELNRRKTWDLIIHTRCLFRSSPLNYTQFAIERHSDTSFRVSAVTLTTQ